jgi:2-methylaconitate cis-trans-isomerase PrpF
VSHAAPHGHAPEVRFGHPSGSLRVGAAARQEGEDWIVSKATMSRSARRLMDGAIFVPESVA